MTTAEQNFVLLQEIEANRLFLLMAYEQNPKLLEKAEPRIKQLFEEVAAQGDLVAMAPILEKQRGISLIELIIFIVIVSTAMAGILLVMNQVTRSSADPLIRKQALAVAESMLEEVRLQTLDPAPCTGALGQNAARIGAGCVNDYNGYSTSGGIKDFSTNGLVPGLGGYDITGVVVTPIAALGGTVIAAGSGVMITVTVVDTMGETVVATGYRAGN
jgi:MSHA pilin protein MshD